MDKIISDILNEAFQKINSVIISSNQSILAQVQVIMQEYGKALANQLKDNEQAQHTPEDQSSLPE
jgi:hypothetical protein